MQPRGEYANTARNWLKTLLAKLLLPRPEALLLKSQHGAQQRQCLACQGPWVWLPWATCFSSCHLTSLEPQATQASWSCNASNSNAKRRAKQGAKSGFAFFFTVHLFRGGLFFHNTHPTCPKPSRACRKIVDSCWLASTNIRRLPLSNPLLLHSQNRRFLDQRKITENNTPLSSRSIRNFLKTVESLRTKENNTSLCPADS